MNRPIRRVSVFAMIMFGLMLINCTYLMVFQQDSLNAHDQNRRVRDAEFAQDRGAILVGTTEVAKTEPVDDRFKFLRSYPEPELYAPITGFYSYDHARSGLEATYNTELAGTDDSLFLRRIFDLLTNKTPTGASIETTINPAAQKAAFEGLGDMSGAVVAIDPKTGAILALATSPSYDPNGIASHDIAAAEEAYQEAAEDEGRPMSNRAARETYPPGSVFKLVTAAAGLESGLSAESKVDSPDTYRLPNTETDLPNQTNCGGAEVTLTQALRTSCNTAFAKLGVDLGDDALREQADAFGFDARHLGDLSAAASRFPDEPDEAQTALSAIGQGDVAATPLQMAMVAAGIANDGVVMDPYLVSTVRAADLTAVRTHEPKELSTAMSPENAQELQDMMVDVVQNGTGSSAQIPGVEVGGKTGTAQWDLDKNPYAWFTAIAPADDTQVAVAVIVEDADIPRSDIAGGRVAAPIAKAVMEAIL